jgi:predicted outer membrane repeat protein
MNAAVIELHDGSRMNITNSTVQFNRCAEKGGAIWMEDSTIGGFFVEDVATEAGGAIELSFAGNISVYKANFTRNNATEFGGAVHMEHSNVTVLMSNFSGNFATFGSAIDAYVSEFWVSVWGAIGPPRG